MNAWILLAEDDPQGTTYFDPDSAFQSAKAVYPYVDMLFLCFAEVVPSLLVPTVWTIQIQNQQHGTPPDVYSNQQYMAQVIADARAANPNIRIGITLDYNPGTAIQQILSAPDPELAADAFAANLLEFLLANDLDGFDIDWEWPISSTTQQAQMTTFLTAIGTTFARAPRKLYLTLSPNTPENLDAGTVNSYVDFINLQIYGGARPDQFTGVTVPFAYGVNTEGGVTAQTAYTDAQGMGLDSFTCWRLNSSNFQFEQQQQQALYQLVHGTT